MAAVQKIRNLKNGCSYKITFYRPVDTQFGPTHILSVSEDQGVDVFEMWSTPAVNKFINSNKLKPHDLVRFTVKQSDKYGFYAENISLFTN